MEVIRKQKYIQVLRKNNQQPRISYLEKMSFLRMEAKQTFSDK